MLDLRGTIIPKSDQLNADDLVGGAMTIKVTNVVMHESPDQPISINYEGDNGKPYKPCKSMRRLLVQIWGYDGTKYIGRKMTLYRDEKVKFAGTEVGGIRISHVSHISEPTKVLITVAKSKRKPITIQPIIDELPPKPQPRGDGSLIVPTMADIKLCLAHKMPIDEVKAIFSLNDDQIEKYNNLLNK